MAKKIPDFNSEEEEKRFWKTHNPLDYVDWSKADAVVSRVFKDSKTGKKFLQELNQHPSPKKNK